MSTQIERDADAAAASFLNETDHVLFSMEEVTRRLRKTFDDSVEQFGLTRTQWRALAYLYRAPGMTQTELARMLELERAGVGQAIDKLENLGLVERRSAKDDRRVWKIHLLPAAIDLLPQLRKEADAVYGQLLKGIPAEDIGVLQEVINAMQANLAVE
ncbi:MAG: MarR family transcriptional regulator [Pseudomonadota bacterium]